MRAARNWSYLWSGRVDGRRLIVTRGKTGDPEPIVDKKFADEKAAIAELERLAAGVKARGWKPIPWPDPTPPPPKAEPTVTVTPKIAAAAKKLRFADSGGSGVIVLPRAVKALWSGTDEDEDGDTDYDRACAAHRVGTLRVGKRTALAIGNAQSTAFYRTRDGGLFIQWGGADSAAACLALALSIPPREWKATRVRFDVGDGDLVMFDNGEPGRSVAAREVAEVRIARGVYRISTVWSFEGVVRRGRRVEETEIAALRLAR